MDELTNEYEAQVKCCCEVGWITLWKARPTASVFTASPRWHATDQLPEPQHGLCGWEMWQNVYCRHVFFSYLAQQFWAPHIHLISKPFNQPLFILNCKVSPTERDKTWTAIVYPMIIQFVAILHKHTTGCHLTFRFMTAIAPRERERETFLRELIINKLRYICESRLLRS